MFDINEYSVNALMDDMTDIFKMATEQIKAEFESMLETQKTFLKTTGIDNIYSSWFNFSPSNFIDYAIVYLNKE